MLQYLYFHYELNNCLWCSSSNINSPLKDTYSFTQKSFVCVKTQIREHTDVITNKRPITTHAKRLKYARDSCSFKASTLSSPSHCPLSANDSDTFHLQCDYLLFLIHNTLNNTGQKTVWVQRNLGWWKPFIDKVSAILFMQNTKQKAELSSPSFHRCISASCYPWIWAKSEKISKTHLTLKVIS